jgi:ATP-dependent DNA helicase RecG
LFLAGKIESWGRGIDLIRNTCTAHGSPVPRFECDSTGFWVEFGFATVETSVETPTETPTETPVKTPVEILRLLEMNPFMTIVEVVATMGKSPSAVHRASAKLVKDGKLKYVGPRKGGHWEVLK